MMNDADLEILKSWFYQEGYTLLYISTTDTWAAGHKDTEDGNKKVTPEFKTFVELAKYMWERMECVKMTEFTKDELQYILEMIDSIRIVNRKINDDELQEKIQSMIANYSPARTEKEILQWIVAQEDEIKDAMEAMSHDNTGYNQYLGREAMLKKLFAFLTND
jgi:vacuolar-type H+-ATPase catalytic subunit A/Vma1